MIKQADYLLSADRCNRFAGALIDRVALDPRTNTGRAYAAGLRYWGAWHGLRFASNIQIPVPAEVILQFLRDHLARNPELEPPAESAIQGPRTTSQHALPESIDRQLVVLGYKGSIGPLPLSTVRARLSALNFAHRQNGLPEPIYDPGVCGTWRRFQRTNNKVPSRHRRGVDPLPSHEFQRLLDACNADGSGLRDRALLLTCWSTAINCGELVAAKIEHVHRIEGAPVLVVQAPKVRRNARTGWPARTEASLLTHKPLSVDAANALKVWSDYLKTHGINQGSLFWTIRDERPDKPMTQESVRDALTRRASLAQVDLYHAAPASLRKGALETHLVSGAPLQDVLSLAGLRAPTKFLLSRMR